MEHQMEAPREFERSSLSPLFETSSRRRHSHVPKSLSTGRIDIPPLFLLAEQEYTRVQRRASMAYNGPWTERLGFDPRRDADTPPIPPIPKSYSMQSIPRPQGAPRAAAMRHPGPPITYNRFRPPQYPPRGDSLRSAPTVAQSNLAASTSAADLSRPLPKSPDSWFPQTTRTNISRIPSAPNVREKVSLVSTQITARASPIAEEASPKRQSKIPVPSPSNGRQPLEIVASGTSELEQGMLKVDRAQPNTSEKKAPRKSTSFFRLRKATPIVPEPKTGSSGSTTNQVRPQRSFFQLKKPSKTPTRIPTPTYNEGSKFIIPDDNNFESLTPAGTADQASSDHRKISPRQDQHPLSNKNGRSLLEGHVSSPTVQGHPSKPLRRPTQESAYPPLKHPYTSDSATHSPQNSSKAHTRFVTSPVGRKASESIRSIVMNSDDRSEGMDKDHPYFDPEAHGINSAKSSGNRELRNSSRSSTHIPSRSTHRFVSTPVLPSQKKENLPPRAHRLLGPISPARTQIQTKLPRSQSSGVLPALQSSLSKPSLNLNNASAQDLSAPLSKFPANADTNLQDIRAANASSDAFSLAGAMVPESDTGKLVHSPAFTIVNGICRVHTAQPTGFWAGRFMGVQTKFYNEMLEAQTRNEVMAKKFQDNTPCKRRGPYVPSVLAELFGEPPDDDDSRKFWTTGLQALEEEEIRRGKRAFNWLDVMCCTTQEARDSLWEFQLSYALMQKRYEWLPYGASSDDILGNKMTRAVRIVEKIQEVDKKEEKEEKKDKWMGKLKKAWSKGDFNHGL